jgi:hypothetical protein
VGNEVPGEVPARRGGSRFQHNLESWRKFWDDIGEEIGVKFEVYGKATRLDIKWRSIGDMALEFSVRRL